MIQSWQVGDEAICLVLKSSDDRMAEIVYFGPTLPTSETDHVAQDAVLDVTGGMLDEHPPLSICPLPGATFPGQPGLRVSEADGSALRPLAFRLSDAQQSRHDLVLSYQDTAQGVRYQAQFSVDPVTHVVSCSSKLSADRPLRLDWLSGPVVPGPQSSDEMIDFAGRWVGEFRAQRTPWTAGVRLRENFTGRTGHEHFPGLIVPSRGCTNTHGEALAFHYGWSGGHRMVAEELSDGRRQIQFGHTMSAELETSTEFETAPLFVVWTDQGLNGIATAFQRHLRERITPANSQRTPRPVHYNCWEAVYFDHNLDTLKEIAERAAALGAERFVLDDGWFGQRDDATSSLGDWDVDPRKYPDGLKPLIDHVNALGMGFGLWFEPEMVNPESQLFRAHPNWALGGPDQILGRNQMVLNLALPEVRDFLFDRLSAILGNHAIEYVKWDHNRVLPAPDAAQTRGVYALIDRLRAAFPTLEIESCAAGGGRIDFGILSRTGRVWLSDSNDAMERLRIQHEAALFLPMTVTGSHIGPRHCHTSGRIIDMETRAWVAAQRHLGFEMDPRELTKEETETLSRITLWWKDNRVWRERADILRLDTEPAITAELQRAEDRSRFVVFAGLTESTPQSLPRPLRLTGLDPEARYKITLISQSAVLDWQSCGNPSLKTGGLTASGRYLMHQGVTLPWAYPQSMWVLEGTRQ